MARRQNTSSRCADYLCETAYHGYKQHYYPIAGVQFEIGRAIPDFLPSWLVDFLRHMPSREAKRILARCPGYATAHP